MRPRRDSGAVPGRMGCESAVRIECGESGAPKGAERFQNGPEAAGPGKAGPGLEPEASLEVPTAERFTPYLNAIRVWTDYGSRRRRKQHPPAPVGLQEIPVTTVLMQLESISTGDTESQIQPEAGTWLVPVSYVSRACLVRGGSSQPSALNQNALKLEIGPALMAIGRGMGSG